MYSSAASASASASSIAQFEFLPPGHKSGSGLCSQCNKFHAGRPSCTLRIKTQFQKTLVKRPS
eukprot:4516740-Amphidinium_carterae.1